MIELAAKVVCFLLINLVLMRIAARRGYNKGFTLGYARGTKHSTDALFTPAFFRRPQLTKRRPEAPKEPA